MTTLALPAEWLRQLRPYVSSLVLAPFCVYFAVVDYGTRGWGGSLWFLVHSLNLLPHGARAARGRAALRCCVPRLGADARRAAPRVVASQV